MKVMSTSSTYRGVGSGGEGAAGWRCREQRPALAPCHQQDAAAPPAVQRCTGPMPAAQDPRERGTEPPRAAQGLTKVSRMTA